MSKTPTTDYLAAIYGIIDSLYTLPETPVEEVWGRIAEQLSADLAAEAGTYYACNAQKTQLLPRRVLGRASAEVGETPVDIRTGICGWVAQHRQSLLIADAYEDFRFLSEVDRLTGFRTKTVLAIPLLDRLELTGVLELLNKRGGPFTDKDLRYAEAACRAASAALRGSRPAKAGSRKDGGK